MEDDLLKADDIRKSPEYHAMRLKLGLEREPKPSRLYSVKVKLSDLIWIRALIMRLFKT